MNAKTLKALRGSIAKWRAIVDGTGTDEGPDNCPLCLIFRYDECIDCPVAMKTGKDSCEGSPYVDLWIGTFPSFHWREYRADTSEREAAAQAELDFLISLLPPGEAP